MEKINEKDNLIRLIKEYQNLVFSICLKLTNDYFVAEDLTQETFLTAYQHLSEFDGKAEKAWLCRIASNKCIDYILYVLIHIWDDNNFVRVISEPKKIL